MNLSLTGQSRFNEHTLCGKSKYTKQNIPTEIKNIKIKIMNDYLIPLYKKQWTKLYENLFFIHKIKKNISKFKHLSNFDDLQLYIDLIQLLELVVEKNNLLENQDDNFKTRFGSKDKDQAISMIFRLTPIRLLPEYELYNSIIGRPKKEFNESYDKEKIQVIQTLLERENMDYEQIKLFLENTL